MPHKSFTCKVKAAGPNDGLGEGQFTALVSVFGNVDSYGDVVMPGAFTDTLADWAKSTSPIPVYWSHRLDDPDYNIGYVLTAEETAAGLQVTAQLDLDAPKAMQVYRLLKGRRVTQFSFSYDIDDAGWAERDGREVLELRKLKLHEVGPTPLGANADTDLLAVKHAARSLTEHLKTGHAPSVTDVALLRKAADTLIAAASQINDLLASLDTKDGTARTAPANDKTPPLPTGPGTSQEPTREVPAQLSALQSIELDAIAALDQSGELAAR